MEQNEWRGSRVYGQGSRQGWVSGGVRASVRAGEEGAGGARGVDGQGRKEPTGQGEWRRGMPAGQNEWMGELSECTNR